MNDCVRRETESWHDAYRSDALKGRRQSGHVKKLARLGIMNLDPQARVLDVCCGEGEVLEILKAKGFKNLYGVDLAQPEAAQGKAPFSYISGAANQLPFADQSMDCVICTHSLHHLGGVARIAEFLQEARRIVKPQGLIAVIDHYDSPQLRTAFALFRSPLAAITAYGRHFRSQLIEEHDYLYEYLDHWPEVLKLLRSEQNEVLCYEKDLFFFYAQLRPGSAL